MFSAHHRCDHCEAVAHIEDEDELLEEGWLLVNIGPEDVAHFDTLECLRRWAGSPAAHDLVLEAAERAQAADHDDEDE